MQSIPCFVSGAALRLVQLNSVSRSNVCVGWIGFKLRQFNGFSLMDYVHALHSMFNFAWFFNAIVVIKETALPSKGKVLSYDLCYCLKYVIAVHLWKQIANIYRRDK
jgi:hypothetical protein